MCRSDYFRCFSQMVCRLGFPPDANEPILDDVLWGQSCQTITLTVEALKSTNPRLLATQPRIDTLGNLIFDVANGHKGQARFSVRIADDGSSAGTSTLPAGTVSRGAPYVGRPGFSEDFTTPAKYEFAICVVAVNQQPTFSTLNVVAPSGTYERQHRVVFAVNISAGPGDVGQTLSWRYSYDNALIFVDMPVLTIQENWIV